MPLRPATLIYNPHAGSWEWGPVVARVVDFWAGRGWRVELRPTQHPGHATALAKAAADAGHGLVLVAGGDGTLNEAANGLAHSQAVLGLLPAGTANSFARELAMPRPNLLDPAWLQNACQLLADGRVQRVDLGRCQGRYWLLWAGAGADSFLVDQIEPRTPLFKRFGVAGYGLKALLTLPGFRGMAARVEVDDQVFEDDFLLITVANCRLFAGGVLPLNAGGVLDDGRFEVWLLRGRRWPRLLPFAAKTLLGLHAHARDVEVVVGQRVRVETRPAIPYQLDGEPVGRTPFTCEIARGALRLLAPASAPGGLFAQAGERLE